MSASSVTGVGIGMSYGIMKEGLSVGCGCGKKHEEIHHAKPPAFCSKKLIIGQKSSISVGQSKNIRTCI